MRARGLVRVEVTGDGEHRVARRVVALEEILGVHHGRRLEVHEAAVAVVGVVERLEHHRRQVDPREPAVRSVVDVDVDLFLDDVDLVAEVVRRDAGPAHAIRLQEQPQIERSRRQLRDVDGEVRVGAAVHHPAVALDEPVRLTLVEVDGALEHQVLEQVRETGAPLGFGPEADVVVHGDAHHGRRTVGAEDDPQSVVERESIDRELGPWKSSGHAGTLPVARSLPVEGAA